MLTHPQRDHIGGAETVLRRVAVERVLDPRLAVVRPVRASGARRRRRARRPGRRDACGRRLPARSACGCACSGRTGAGSPTEDPNRLPIVLLATYGEVDALLTADAETEVTARLLSRRVEILKVAHHGSADPGLASELRELRPAVAVISCGRGNDYGHPTASTLAALRESPGLSLFRTDEDGQVVVESDGRRLSVRTGR